ncbi:MAG: DUF6076 domain-containing protein [Clostridia bacterium]|nr:DUF6076 domain-containing protein [Clostridia bacterium]
MNNEILPISIYVDKNNRLEYITHHRYVKKYKIVLNKVDMFYTKDEIKKFPKCNQYVTNDDNLFYVRTERKYSIEVAGTYLTNFLNTDFGNIDELKEYAEMFGLYVLTNMCNMKIELKEMYSKQEYDELIQYIFDNYVQDIEKVKSDFIRVVDYVYNLYDLKEIEHFTPYERYYTLSISRMTNAIEKYSDKLELDFETNANWLLVAPAGPKEKYIYEQIGITRKDKKKELIQSPYFISSTSFASILYISLVELIAMKDFPIKKCQNCGKYFVPQKRTDEIYCNNVYQDGLTCRQIGSQLFRKKKLQDENSIDRLYRNAYQQKFLRMQRNPKNQQYKEEFEWFKQRVKEIRQEMKDETKTEEDFKKWLLAVKDKGIFEE